MSIVRPLPSKAASVLYGKDKNKLFDRLGISQREFDLVSNHSAKAIQQLGIFDGISNQMGIEQFNQLKQQQERLKKLRAGPNDENWDFVSNRSATATAAIERTKSMGKQKYSSNNSDTDNQADKAAESTPAAADSLLVAPEIPASADFLHDPFNGEPISPHSILHNRVASRDAPVYHNPNLISGTGIGSIGGVSKAQDLLFGGHKSDSNKLHDKLGLSQKELETFENAPKAFNKLGVQAFLAHSQDRKSQESNEAIEAGKSSTAAAAAADSADSAGSALHSPPAHHGISHKAQDILYGGSKHANKPLDRLGISLAESEKFDKISKAAYNKLGIFDAAGQKSSAGEKIHFEENQNPQQPTAEAESSESELSHSAGPIGGHPMSRKASDLIFGGSKSQTKQSDRLGVNDKEIKEFSEKPKAYLNLGLYQKSPQSNYDPSSSPVLTFSEPLKAHNRLEPLPITKSSLLTIKPQNNNFSPPNNSANRKPIKLVSQNYNSQAIEPKQSPAANINDSSLAPEFPSLDRLPSDSTSRSQNSIGASALSVNMEFSLSDSDKQQANEESISVSFAPSPTIATRSIPPPIFKRAQSKFTAFPVIINNNNTILPQPQPQASTAASPASDSSFVIKTVSIRPVSAVDINAERPNSSSFMNSEFLSSSLSRDGASSSSSNIAIQSAGQKPNRPPLIARAKTKFINRTTNNNTTNNNFSSGGNGSGNGSGIQTPIEIEFQMSNSNSSSNTLTPAPPSVVSPKTRSITLMNRASKPKV